MTLFISFLVPFRFQYLEICVETSVINYLFWREYTQGVAGGGKQITLHHTHIRTKGLTLFSVVFIMSWFVLIVTETVVPLGLKVLLFANY